MQPKLVAKEYKATKKKKMSEIESIFPNVKEKMYFKHKQLGPRKLENSYTNWLPNPQYIQLEHQIS